MKITDPLVYPMAVKRITDLVVNDEITRPIREKAEERGGRLAYLVSCSRCVSVWAGLIVLILPRPLVAALALSQSVRLVEWTAEVTEEMVSH